MQSLSEFEGLCDKYSDVMDFICVYITEAHPIESGDFDEASTNIQMHTAKDLEGKLSNARELANHTKLPIYVDQLDNHACRQYAAFPERYGLYVILITQAFLK